MTHGTEAGHAATPGVGSTFKARHEEGTDMRELFADLFITLDGYAFGEGVPAYFGYFGPDLERWIDDQMATPQAIVMGRVTYEALSAVAQNEPVEGDDQMNQVPKLVFSKTLQEPLEWNNSRVVRADVADEIRSLKAQPGDLLRTFGSLSLVRALMVAGLVDRLRLVVFRQILGHTGREPLFAGLPDINLELIDTKVLDSRLVTLEYYPRTVQ